MHKERERAKCDATIANLKDTEKEIDVIFSEMDACFDLLLPRFEDTQPKEAEKLITPFREVRNLGAELCLLRLKSILF